MNSSTILVAALVTLTTTSQLHAAAFQNLDFEQGSLVIVTSPDVVSTAAAFPAWNVQLFSQPAPTTIICNRITLDWTQVALNSDLLPFGHPPQGHFGIYLQSVNGTPQNYVGSPSVSQMGDIPANAKTLRFSAQLDPIANTISPPPTVFLDTTMLNVFPISTTNGVTFLAADISAFAGTTHQLTFEAVGAVRIQPGPFTEYETGFTLDAISFSPLTLADLGVAIPEPTTLSLLTLTTAALLTRRRK